MKNINIIKRHLSNNSGDENISKLIWIVIVFVVGAIALTLITTAFNSTISSWYESVLDSWFGTNGAGYEGTYPL